MFDRLLCLAILSIVVLLSDGPGGVATAYMRVPQLRVVGRIRDETSLGFTLFADINSGER